MAFSLVNSVSIAPGTGNGGTSGAISTVGANLIIFTSSQSTVATPTLSDSQGNTYTVLGKSPSSFGYSWIAYCVNPTTSASHTFTINGTVPDCQASGNVAAFSGSLASPLDQQINTAANTGSMTIQPGSLTPGQNNELIITSVQFGLFAGQSPTIDSGFSLINVVGASQYYPNGLGYFIQTTASAVNPTWTVPSSPTSLGATMATFKAGTDANVNLSGVSATAAAGTLAPNTTASVALTGVSATAAVGTLSLGVTSSVALLGISAAAHAGTLATGASATVDLQGVGATAFAGDLFVTLNLLTVPMVTIMNDFPIPVSGTMEDDDVPMTGDMPSQLAFESVINRNPIAMMGTLSAAPVPGEGSVP